MILGYSNLSDLSHFSDLSNLSHLGDLVVFTSVPKVNLNPTPEHKS